MQKITNAEELREAIVRLEDRKKAEQELLKAEFQVTKEKLKPSNVVRNTFSQIFTGPNLIRTVMIITVGLTAGYITKKYFQGLTGRLLRRLLGRVMY
ncbi:MAG TPA: hypothetical protein VK155_04710 [Bacteroidales bacterium]|jgi:hypothetical protein|nr:hypothetical protein [Bacteroidales bacterium]